MKDPSLPDPTDFKCHCDIEVRFRDCDSLGHVNNAVYLTYFEIARTGYMKQLGHVTAESSSMEEIYPFIMLDVYCRYLAPVKLGDVLRAYIKTSHFGTKSFEFTYLITKTKDNTKVATGRSTQVYYDYQHQKSLPIPDPFRHAISHFESSRVTT